MNLLDLQLDITWSKSKQSMVASILVRDLDNVYARLTATDHSPLYLWWLAQNLWVKTSLDILEQEAQALDDDTEDNSDPLKQLSIFTES